MAGHRAPSPKPPDEPTLALHDLEVALAILTRLPSRLSRPPGPRELEASVQWFPFAGALVGGIAALAYLVAGLLGLPGLSGLLAALATQLLVTGALHELGSARTVALIADTSEPPGGGRPERGTLLAVVALVLLLLARVAALTSFWSPTSFAAALIGASAVSRAALPIVLLATPATTRLRPERSRVALGLGLAAAIALALLPPFLAVQAILWAGLAAAVTTVYLVRRLGGCDGDGLGAVQQAAELAFLTALAAEGWPG